MPRISEAARLRRADTAGSEFVEALARGLEIISAFGREQKQLSLSDVARATKLPKASVRRMLHTLMSLGYAATDGRVFRLTPRVLTLASDYLGSNKVSTVVQPTCQRIAAETGRSCFVAVLEGHDIVVVAHGLPDHPMELSPGIGLRLPAFCTAAGRAILSTFDEPTLDAWLKTLEPRALTRFTPVTDEAIRKPIHDARERGYGATEQDVKLGDCALAVPLNRYDGRTIAALNVTGLIHDPQTEQRLALLRAAAKDLEPQLF
jgi:IclR family transcriptional regulator, pca regulon regulatory protein